MTDTGQREKRPLSLLLHGDTKSGKSTMSFTAPGPLLALDAEGSTKFLTSKADGTKFRKIKWDPMTQYPPACGDWDVCVVRAVNWAIVEQAYKHLVASPHCFRSVTLDSVTEIQRKCKANLKGTEQMQQQDWGMLLARMDDLIRGIRDLGEVESNPLEVAVFIAETVLPNNAVQKVPNMQGAVRTSMPYWVDLLGYVHQVPVPDANGQDSGARTVNLICGNNNLYLAGNRFQGMIPSIVGSPISITDIQNHVYA